MLDTTRQDLRYAFRNLKRSPLFAGTAVLTLALGIGANTAIFSAIDQALFRPLDFPRPAQLADVFTFNKASRSYLSGSYPDYEDFRARTKTFQQLSAFVRMPFNVAWGERSERLPVEAVTGNFFSMLELPPVAGRAFSSDDDRDGGTRVAMISEDLAGGESVGKKIAIEGEPFTVIGIVPKKYKGTNLNWGDPPRFWIPLQSAAIVQPRFRTLDIFHKRAMQWLLVTGRLRPGIGVERAQAEIGTIAAGIARSEPATNRDITVQVFSASRAKFWPAYRDSIARSLFVFAAAAGLVLLLTCANITNLLLGRAVGRRREFAIRVSIGAGRARLVRQLLTELLLLSALSCLCAVGIAHAMGLVLLHFPNALGLTLALDANVESRALWFCIALSVATTVLFGLAPALGAARSDVIGALKETGSAVSGGRDATRHALVALQVTFCMVLLVGGGLFGRSVMRAWAADLGFRPEGLLTAEFSSPPPGAGSVNSLRRAQATLLDRLRAMPGVQSVTLASDPPLNHLHSRAQVRGDAAITADRHTVGSDFFRTLGIPLLSGREFEERDDAAGPKVAIVNQALAQRLWPGVDALGKTVTLQNTKLRIVGVVRDSRYGSVWEDAPPYLYLSDAQSDAPANDLIVRSTGDPGNLVAAITAEWNRLQPRSPLYDIHTGNELLNVALAPQRMAAGIFGAFGLLAIVLASVGLYSVMAYAVARRTREIGIRLAIGARPAMMMRQILQKSMTVVLAGVLAGAAISALLARFVASQVKGISVYDGATFAAAAVLLSLVSFLAALIPARRAARIDPQISLRSE